MTDDAPEPRPGVKPERLNAYRTAKDEAPRNALPSDLLSLAAFLAAIDEEPEKDEEEDAEIIGGAEFDDDRADDNEGATEAFLEEDEEGEDAGFEPVEGRYAWPTVMAWLENYAPPGTELAPWQVELLRQVFK